MAMGAMGLSHGAKCTPRTQAHAPPLDAASPSGRMAFMAGWPGNFGCRSGIGWKYMPSGPASLNTTLILPLRLRLRPPPPLCPPLAASDSRPSSIRPASAAAAALPPPREDWGAAEAEDEWTWATCCRALWCTTPLRVLHKNRSLWTGRRESFRSDASDFSKCRYACQARRQLRAA